jgi:hypothetical protein
MHLDMNGKHTGLEFYQPYEKNQVLPELGRPLRSTEYEGPVSEANGMRFRARLAVTTMAPLRFPRYLGQDPRDYFYLTRKPILPGADLQTDGGTIPFNTQELPTAGFPHAFARAHVPEAGWIVRIDLGRAVPKPLADASLARVLGHLTFNTRVGPVPDQAGATLHAHYIHGHLRAEIGRPRPGSATLCSGPLVADLPDAAAGLGVDAEGFLVYAEVAPGGNLGQLLRTAGVAQAIALPEGRLVLADAAGPRGVDGQAAPLVDEATSLALMAETRAPAQVLFRDVTPLPYRKWGWLQDQRVRYFPSGPARFQAPESATQ